MFMLIRLFIHAKKKQYCNDLEVPHILSFPYFPFLFNMGFLVKQNLATVKANAFCKSVLNGYLIK